MTDIMKRIARREVHALRQIKDCNGHEWIGPSREVPWADDIKYLYHCKHCPLAKLFDRRDNS